MKKSTLFAIIIILVIAGFVYFNKDKQVAVDVLPGDGASEKNEVCYYKETKGEETSDHAFTSVNYSEGGKVTGIMNWIPGEKDSLVGSYQGTVEVNPGMEGYPERLNILYTASGEGIVNKQQEILVVGSNDIKTAVGDKEQGVDGIWKFKTGATLTYTNALPKVDCSVVPERIKKDYSNI